MDKQMNDYDKKLYESACKKWGKEIVDDEWGYWDPIEIEQGFIIGTQNVFDITYKENPTSNENKILKSGILIVDYIDSMNYVKEYYDLNEQANFSYMGFYMTHRDKLAFDKGIMIDIELLHLLARFDDENEDNDINKYWYVVKCTENDKLKKKLKEYFRNKYNAHFNWREGKL